LQVLGLHEETLLDVRVCTGEDPVQTRERREPQPSATPTETSNRVGRLLQMVFVAALAVMCAALAYGQDGIPGEGDLSLQLREGGGVATWQWRPGDE
jgi:hypothetical protein